MKEFMEYLPYLMPVLLLELMLGLYSARHVWKHRTYRFGNMAFWLIIVLVVQLIGPILYFTIGRGENYEYPGN